jgi:hypothetical protein
MLAKNTKNINAETDKELRHKLYENNREKYIKSSRKYYESKKDELNKTIECKCGVSYLKKNKSIHCKTRAHIGYEKGYKDACNKFKIKQTTDSEDSSDTSSSDTE